MADARIVEVCFDMCPDQRYQIDVVRLSINQRKPGEDAEDAQISLKAQQRIGPSENLTVTRRRLQLSDKGGHLRKSAHIASRILKHRDEIICGMTKHRILKVK